MINFPLDNDGENSTCVAPHFIEFEIILSKIIDRLSTLKLRIKSQLLLYMNFKF